MHMHTIVAAVAATAPAGKLTDQAIILVLSAAVIVMMIQRPNPGLLDYIVTIVLGIFLATTSLVQANATIITNFFVKLVGGNDVLGASTYWLVVIVLMALGTFLFFKGFGQRNRWKNHKGWLLLVFLMSGLISASTAGQAIIGALNTAAAATS